MTLRTDSIANAFPDPAFSRAQDATRAVIRCDNFPLSVFVFPSNQRRFAYYTFPIARDYVDTPVTNLFWFARSGAAAGTVTWSVAWAVMATNGSINAQTKAFAAENSSGGISVPSTPSGVLTTAITISNPDSAANSKLCVVRVQRDVIDQSFGGDAYLVGAQLGYDDV